MLPPFVLTVSFLIFQASEPDYEFEVRCSYCEVYNEVIFDLLVPDSGPLDLR